MSAGGKSGPALGAENVEKLRAYLDDLKARGLSLPTRGGEINMSAIALGCGFNRQVLYVNEGAKALLEEAVGASGVAEARLEDADDEKPVSRSDRRDRRIHQLEQANAALRAENHGLRERLRRLEHVEAVMMSGRRVAP